MPRIRPWKTYRAGDTRNLHGVDSGDAYKVGIDFLAVESFGLVTEGVNKSGFQMSVQFYRDMTLDDAQKNDLAQLELAAYLLGNAHTVKKALAMVKQLQGRDGTVARAFRGAGRALHHDGQVRGSCFAAVR